MLKKAAVLVVAVWTAATILPAKEFPLELKPLDEAQVMPCANVFGAMAQVTTKKPAEIKAEPAAANRPLYGLLALGKTPPVALRIGRSSASSAYDRMIVDVNRNGDLQDDKAIEIRTVKMKMPQEQEVQVAGPIKIEREGGPVSVQVLLHLMPASIGPGGGSLQVFPAQYHEATVEIDGVRERLGFVDANCNLVLGDIARDTGCTCENGPHLSFQSDVVLRDNDRSGAYDMASLTCEAERLADVIYLGAKPYKVEVATDQKAVVIEPYTGAVAEITGAFDKVAQLVVVRKEGENDWIAITPHAAEGKVVVPEGRYALWTCMVGAKDDAGALWKALGAKGSAKESFLLKAGETRALKFGAALELKTQSEVQVAQSGGLLRSLFGGGSRERYLRTSVEVTGAGGEKYTEFGKDNGQVKPPTCVIRDADGKELASGRMEYG